jgi:hypothetical protein
LRTVPGKCQTVFCRRRHQPRRPPLAKIRPGKPAPTIGAGTDATPEPISPMAPEEIGKSGGSIGVKMN